MTSCRSRGFRWFFFQLSPVSPFLRCKTDKISRWESFVEFAILLFLAASFEITHFRTSNVTNPTVCSRTPPPRSARCMSLHIDPMNMKNFSFRVLKVNSLGLPSSGDHGRPRGKCPFTTCAAGPASERPRLHQISPINDAASSQSLWIPITRMESHSAADPHAQKQGKSIHTGSTGTLSLTLPHVDRMGTLPFQRCDTDFLSHRKYHYP